MQESALLYNNPGSKGKSRKLIIRRLTWILTVAWIVVSYVFVKLTYGAIILLGITMLLLLLNLIENNWHVHIKKSKLYNHMVVMGLYFLATAIWSWDRASSIQQGVTIFEILVSIVVFYMCYQNEDDVWNLVNALKWSGFIVSLYSFFYYGVDGINEILVSSDRLDNEYANVNTLGMLASISIIIVAYELLFVKKNLVSIAFAIPCVMIMAASGSRKALLMVLIGVIALLFFRYSTKSVFKTMFRFVIISVVVYFALRFILSLDMFSGVMGRMEGLISFFTGEGTMDASAKARDRLVTLGMTQFYQNPVLGIGMGSSLVYLKRSYGVSTYLHNNYVELLCCGGILGLLAYYSTYFTCIKNLLKYKLRDPLSKLCLILIGINVIMEYGSVAYNTKITFIYFLIFFLHIANLKRKERENAYQKAY